MKGNFLQLSVKLVFLILMGLLVLTTPVLFLIFFVPVVGWILWTDHDRIADLEAKLAEKEKAGDKTTPIQKD